MASELGMATRDFTRKYCTKTNGWFHLKDMQGDCVFLSDKKCTVYEGRPAQCRTWPFWPENMNAKIWNTEVAKFCPGVGKGRVHTPQEIEKQLAMDRWKG